MVYLRTPFDGGVLRFRLLNILEFTSARKRMSVVLRRLRGSVGKDGGVGVVGEKPRDVMGVRRRKGRRKDR